MSVKFARLGDFSSDMPWPKAAIFSAALGCTMLAGIIIGVLSASELELAQRQAEKISPAPVLAEPLDPDEQVRQSARRELARVMLNKAHIDQTAHLTAITPDIYVAQTTTAAMASASLARESGVATTRTSATMQLDPEDMQRLAGKAADAIRAGDIASARLVLEHAMRAGDATAIYALAETYDPRVLARMRVQGMQGEPDKARALYRRALDAGIEQARDKL